MPCTICTSTAENAIIKANPPGAVNTERALTDPPGISWKAATHESIAHPITQSNFVRSRLSRRAALASGGFVLSPIREGATMPP